MSEEMRCYVCKKDVDPEVSDDGTMSYCPICQTGYYNISYAAYMREQADEAAVLSEFENETRPNVVRQLTQRTLDGAKAEPKISICGHGIVPAEDCYICFPPRR
jgi:uncharacterized Zn finger protein (UPF0148 family)